jgi:uncharacterized protein (DUF488 family)
MKIFTIGFTKSKASNFFSRLKDAEVEKIYDTRLNRTSQLSGFAKQDDLAFFLDELSGIKYNVEALLAPTKDILQAYRKKEIDWAEYERLYLNLLDARKIEDRIDFDEMHNGCLLCSEAEPDHCHRRLAANYIANAKENIEIVHL